MDNEKEGICPWCGEFIGANWGVIGSSMFPPNVFFIIKHYECGHLIKKIYKTEWQNNIALTEEEADKEKISYVNFDDDNSEEEFSEDEIELADAEME